MKNSDKPILSPKEQYFCHHYLNTGNAKEAAFLAGYKKNSEKKAVWFLAQKKINAEIERLYNEKKKNLLYKAVIGYERLAFGEISDAVQLLYSNELSKDMLNAMDLFNISEIKSPKPGSMEIKFFDRLKALEKLEQINLTEKNELNPFYYALEKGMQSLAAKENSHIENFLTEEQQNGN